MSFRYDQLSQLTHASPEVSLTSNTNRTRRSMMASGHCCYACPIVPLSRTRSFVFVVVVAAMFAMAAVVPSFRITFIWIALFFLLLLATSLSPSGRLTEALRTFQHRPLEIRVWGEPLPQTGEGPCQIESLRAIGAGLHLFVRCATDEITHLKIAQPRAARIGDQIAEIREAAYVQWSGKKLRRTSGSSAITITIVSDRTAVGGAASVRG